MRLTEILSRNAKIIAEVSRCFATFFLIAWVLLIIASKMTDTRLIFAFLMLTGWLSWTFTEYALHRFWMHNFFRYGKSNLYDIHLEHHKHPKDMKVNGYHRFLTFSFAIVILAVAIYLNNYFTLFAGFCLGFSFYSFLHYLLHQPWCRYIMPNLQKAHIHHHGKYPDKGFSFSVILWDWLFDTLPPKEAEITDKMLSFYFKKDSRNIQKKEIRI
jgi:sterol desaturase/sphingolipid hydroxylase (fatty acid hydroxylase superfamily)